MARSTGVTILTAILGLNALVNGAPLASSSTAAPVPTTSRAAYVAPPIIPGTYSALPTASAQPVQPAQPPVQQQQQPIATFSPDFTSQYNSRTGAVDFHTERGLVSRSPSNGGADITTLVTFQIPSQYKSNSCQIVFDLVNPSSTVAGTSKAQLFTSLAPAYTDSESWPNGNLRNQMIGTIDIVAGGRATWEAGSGPGATNNGVFPCSTIAGQIYGGEIVPQGDYDSISWLAQQDGVKILVF